MYSTIRCIVDAIINMIFIDMPTNPSTQQFTFSYCKNHNTFKALIAMTPCGAINFISDLYSGNISDKNFTEMSGLLTHLEPGEAIMADRGGFTYH